MNLKESICEILSDKKAKREGLHVKHIARHIYNLNNNLFADVNENGFDILKRKVNRILANDVKKKRNILFVKACFLLYGDGKVRKNTVFGQNQIQKIELRFGQTK